MIWKTNSAVPAAILGGLLVAGCGGDSGNDNNSGNSADGGSGTGMVSLQATDAPVDNVSRVQVTLDRIVLQPSGGPRQSFELDPAETIDLLAFTGDDAALILPSTEVPAGEYNFVRLYVVGGANPPGGGEGSFVSEDNGGDVDLFIPGQQNGNGNADRFLQLNAASNKLVVPSGGSADFTIDFDLRKALTRPSGQDNYLLRPALRLINNVEVGTIAGIVDDPLVTASPCSNDPNADEGSAVYLYDGFDAVPGDVYVDDTGEPIARDSEDAPVTTATVAQDSDTGAYEYTIGFVEGGDYTVAFSCQSLDDDPTSDDDVQFVQPTSVTVTAGEQSTVDFTVSSSTTD